jgi:hypothetical protein
MRVALGTFARSGIESRFGGEVVAGVQAALLHYTRRLRSSRRPVAFPRFRREAPSETSGLDLELPIDPSIEAELQREVLRQGVSIEDLAEHAILVFLADLDAAAVREEHADTDAPRLL